MNTQNKSPFIVVQVESPYINKAMFCEKTNFSLSMVNKLIKEGFLQVKKMEGKSGAVFINMADLAFKAAKESISIQEYLKSINKKG